MQPLVSGGVLSNEGELHRIYRGEQIGDPIHADPHFGRECRQLGKVDRAPGEPGRQAREPQIADLRDGLALAQAGETAGRLVCEGPREAGSTDRGDDVGRAR